MVTWENWKNFPLHFNQLKKLTFYNFGTVFQNYEWIESLPNGQNLEELSIPITTFLSQRLIEYSKRFPNLKSLEILGVLLYDDAFFQFLADTKIISITIRMIPPPFAVELKSNLIKSNLLDKFNMIHSSEGFILQQNSG